MANPLFTTTGFPTTGIVPPDIANQVLNKLVGGSPFANSLVRYDTTRHSVIFPLAGPDDAEWTAEGDPLPDLTLNDTAYQVIPMKLGGVYAISNEMIGDTTFDVTGSLNQVIKDTLSHQLDLGLLDGDGTPPNPQGVIEVAPLTAFSSNLAQTALVAAGEIGDAGGQASHIALKPSQYAAEIARLGAGNTMFPVIAQGADNVGVGGLTIGGLIPIQVPGISQPLVYDASRLFFIVRSDFEVAVNPYLLFKEDQVAVRIRGRFAVAVPVAGKAARKLATS